MNLSGHAVGEAMRFYKLEPSDLLVIYDELDLPPGKLRMKTGGGAGGHNGLRSIDGHIGHDFRRMRIGIGHPGIKEMVSPHVLTISPSRTRTGWSRCSTPSPTMADCSPRATTTAS